MTPGGGHAAFSILYWKQDLMDAKKKYTAEREGSQRTVDSASMTLTLHGTTSAHATVEIYDAQSNPVGTTQADENGRWAYTTEQAASPERENFSITVDGLVTQDFSIRLDTLSSETTPLAVPTVETGSNTLGVSATDSQAGDAGPQLQIELKPQAVAESIIVEPEIAVLESATALTFDTAYDTAGYETGLVESGATIDDSRPYLSGKSEAIGTFVKIYDNGEYLTSAFVDLQGNWQVRPSTESALQPGVHELTVVDSLGQTSEPFLLTVSILEASTPLIDSVFDSVGTPGEIAPGASSDDTTPTFHGRGEPGAQVLLYDGAFIVGSSFVGPDGRFTVETGTPLTPGQHTLTVAVNRIASQPFTFTVEDTEPATQPTISSVIDDFGKFGEITNGGSIDDATPTLWGTAAPHSQVAIYDGTTRLGYALTRPDGNWQFQAATLSQGEHSLTAVTKTPIGTELSSDTFTLTIGAPESAKPQIDQAFDNFGKYSELVNGSLTDDATPALRGKADPFAMVQIYDGSRRIGYAHSNADGIWEFQVPPLNQGTHVFTVVNAGVSSDPFTLTIGAPESTAPVITSVVDNIGTVIELASGSVTNDARPTFHGQGEPLTLLKVYDNGKLVDNVTVLQDGSWTYTNINKKLSPGEHTFTFVGEGATSEAFVLNVQDVPQTPTPQVDSALDQAGDWTGSVTSGATIDDYRPVFSGQAEPNSAVFVYDDRLFIGAARAGEDGQWTFQPSEFSPLSPGTHTFTVITDGVTSEPFVLHVEATAPGIETSGHEREPQLPLLSDLLQPASELFAGDASVIATGEAVLDLSLAGFNESLELAPVTTNGVSVFSPAALPQP